MPPRQHGCIMCLQRNQKHGIRVTHHAFQVLYRRVPSPLLCPMLASAINTHIQCHAHKHVLTIKWTVSLHSHNQILTGHWQYWYNDTAIPIILLRHITTEPLNPMGTLITNQLFLPFRCLGLLVAQRLPGMGLQPSNQRTSFKLLL